LNKICNGYGPHPTDVSIDRNDDRADHDTFPYLHAGDSIKDEAHSYQLGRDITNIWRSKKKTGYDLRRFAISHLEEIPKGKEVQRIELSGKKHSE
jgi:hypothetical protein